MPAIPLIDAHLHLWDPARFAYPWLADFPSLAKAHGPAELEAALGSLEVTGLVFVQCDCEPAQAAREVDWVRGLAATETPIGAIVAGLQVELGEEVRGQLEAYAADPRVKGVRRLIQSEQDPDFCLRPDFVQGVGRLAAHDLSFDLCLRHEQLEAVTRLVGLLPDVRFVLDHLAKPDVRAGALDPWRARLRELAARPNVVCKLSGLVTEADHAAWTPEDLRPFVDHAVDCFGFERLMFGSDWPVSTLAGGYRAWVEALDSLLAGISLDEARQFWRESAARTYRMGLD
jgi:L-fuconolactonase